MKLRTLLLLSALTLTGPALAFADNAPATSPAGDHRHPSPVVMQHLADGRVAYIETALNLSGDQRKLWQPVADLLRQPAVGHPMAGYQPGERPSSLSDVLNHHAQAMASRAAYDEKLATALKSLEASLSPEQKETLKIAFFTSLPRPLHERPGFGGGMGPHHEGGAPMQPDDAPGTQSQPG
ncbi:MAG TPA: Spy/CpxP family protein refolding chaperone [Terriglobia bacterium]|nr:Spy/CpxP family protein refolding chaperone [Terriglobia bacterium]